MRPLVVCLVLTALRATFADAQAAPSRVQLDPGRWQEHEFAPPAESHSYALALEADTSLRLTVRPRGADVVLVLRGPQGAVLVEVDDGWTDAPEQLDWVVDAAGTYEVQVRSKRPPLAGGFAIRAETSQPASAADRDRGAATQARWEGALLLSQGKAEKTRGAVGRFERAGQLSRSAHDDAGAALALQGLGWAAALLGEYPTALERYEASLAIFQQLHDEVSQVITLTQIVDAFVKTARFDEALEVGEQALDIAHEAGDREGEAQSLLALSATQSFLGRHALAVAANERALAQFRLLGDRTSEVNAVANLANILQAQGDWDRMLGLLQEALPVVRELGNRLLEAQMLNRLGTVYNSYGDGQRAAPYFERALGIRREQGDRASESVVLANLAAAYRLGGDYARAVDFLQQTLVLKRTIGDRRGEAAALNSLGAALARQADPARARDALEQSLAIAQAAAETRVSALSNLAGLAIERGDYLGARALSLQALDVAETSGLPVQDPLLRLAQAEMGQGDLAEADALAGLLQELLESWRTGLRSEDLRSSLMESWREFYDLRVDILMARHAAQPEAGFAALALQAVERGRARSLLDLLAESHAQVRQGVDARLLEREQTLRARLSEASARSVRRDARSDQANDLEVEELRRAVDQATAEMRKQSPRYAALTSPEPVDVADVQALLDEDTLLLEYSLGKDRSYAWLVTRHSLASAPLPPRATVEAAARRAFAALESDRHADQEDSAAELSRLVLSPFAERLQGLRLVLVADGALQYVPFAALPHPKTGAPLVATHEVVSLPSASTLALLREERRGRAPARSTVAVLADPVFDATDERLGRSAVVNPVPATGPARLTRAAEDAGLSGPIPRLPFTRREANAIVEGLPAGAALTAMDFEASRDTAMDPKLASYRIIHFATHGFLNASHPELSGIVLSLVDKQGRAQAGFLTAADTFNLKLSADLVVLSGCRTALGREAKAEGLVGLTRGFMYAGAVRVLASLWRVDDAATAALMSRFYAGMFGRQAPPAAALRAAQLDLMKQPRFRHPSYWAAFQLQGDWQ